MNEVNGLSGWQIVIMRPPHQAQSLCDLVSAQGGQAISLPMVDILPLSLNVTQLNDYTHAIEQADYVIVVSANAAYCLPTILIEKCRSQLRAGIIAMGKGTASALQEQQIPVAYVATGAPSEALLTQSFLASPQIQDKKIVLLAGKEGRTLLATTLHERGAEVKSLFVYEQRCPEMDLAPYYQQWQHSGHPICFVVTSGNILANLLKLTPTSCTTWLLQQPLLVVSERIAKQATEYGFKHIYVSDEPYPEKLLSTLLKQIKICHTISSL